MNKKVKYIVILGPDGSGKTTIADALAKELSSAQPVRRHNFSFGIMPPISRVVGRATHPTTTEGQRNAGMVKPVRRMRAIILSIWYGIDHILGYFTLIKLKPGTVVIFARSYHDFLYQRAYLNLPKFIPRLFIFLGPKPNFVASLVRNAQVIHSQKPELTIDEINEQYFRISERFLRYRYFDKINAENGINSTIAIIRKRLGI